MQFHSDNMQTLQPTHHIAIVHSSQVTLFPENCSVICSTVMCMMSHIHSVTDFPFYSMSNGFEQRDPNIKS